jgi:hypothetical protein
MAGLYGPTVLTGMGNTYIDNRKRWKRPQAMLWSNNPGEVVKSGSYSGATYPLGQEGVDFIVISDHSRAPISVDFQRIENRMRMVNGNMRSYHTADKLAINTSWSLLPSRSYHNKTTYAMDGSRTPAGGCEYTADGGAGGVDMMTWYRNTTGPMWVFLSYDNFENYVDENGTPSGNEMEMINYFPDRYQMFFSAFNYSIEKRGIYDMWNISVSLEEA